jgi:hypothetical protein
LKRFLYLFGLLWLMLAAVVLTACFAGCHAAPPAFTPSASIIGTPERVRTLEQAHANLAIQVDAFGTWLNNLPGNAVDLDVLRGKFEPIRMGFDAETLAIKPLAPAVAADVKHTQAVEKKNADLEAADPVKFWLNLVGALLVAAGVAVIVMSFLPWTLWAAPFRGIAISAVIVGFVLLTLVRFMHQIELAIIITGSVALAAAIAWAIWYAYQHRATLLDAKSLIAANQLAIATGALNLKAAAPIFNSAQTAGAKKLVDDVKKSPPPTPPAPG